MFTMSWILPFMTSSTMLGLPSCILLIRLASIPFFTSSSWVVPVARMLNPHSAKILAVSTTSGLSLPLTENSTVPDVGSLVWVASWALKNASPTLVASPSTSPVERISGPSTGSTSWNILKGNTASFTP